jgi:hypothetical protein
MRAYLPKYLSTFGTSLNFYVFFQFYLYLLNLVRFSFYVFFQFYLYLLNLVRFSFYVFFQFYLYF